MATDELLTTLATLELRPYDYVVWAFPWGEAETELEMMKLEEWQELLLRDLQRRLILGDCTTEEAIQIAVKSGHNVGKSALLAMVLKWALDTKVDTRGRCTANTEKQLRTILWSELAKWHRLSLTRELFKMTATAYYSADPNHEKTWRLDCVPWSEDNPDAFSGLHNYGKRIIIVFDEASGIADTIWERTDGVMREANTQLMWIATSNPTRNSGRFFECFNKFKPQWITHTVDSRGVSFTNTKKIESDLEAWGRDSDYAKVRIYGEFPDASFQQLFPRAVVLEAQSREPTSQSWEPLILAVDIARYGNNESVAVFRRGRDGRSLPMRRWQGLDVVQSGNLISGLIAASNPDAVFIDEGGVGGGVVDFVRHLGHACIGVQFGSKPGSMPGGILVMNKRAEMYVLFLEWLKTGGSIDAGDDILEQLMSIDYKLNDRTSEFVLVSKEDMRRLGKPSPDIADAYAMTFAFPVSGRTSRFLSRAPQVEYNPFAYEQLKEAS